MQSNFVKHFKNDKNFRLSIILFLIGMVIVLAANIVGLPKGTFKTVITFVGVALSFGATQHLSSILAVIGAEDYEAREKLKKTK